ncbi:GFA family protein [Tahibacter amnicola]|uniref:GFA family protein n=1 Tax=Tahibacter amnicola TaxID=2976241 RepID=A0ABY6BLY9_9GAMM|nr:GFA family protein [Tahibacter amnicola]UXI70468.1 GFA family protein [Tahibacter amnicola]
MHTGSCLCGEIRYEIRGDLGPAFFCHCSRCRKASGSAFASNVVVAETDFAITRGEHLLGTFRSSEETVRCFCTRCGSPIMSRRGNLGQVRVRMGTLDSTVTKGPGAHIFVASKAPWYEIHDAVPAFDERPTV